MPEWIFKTLSVIGTIIGIANTLWLFYMNWPRLRVSGRVIGNGPFMEFTARIVNLSHREARIERVGLAVSFDEGKPKKWGLLRSRSGGKAVIACRMSWHRGHG